MLAEARHPLPPRVLREVDSVVLALRAGRPRRLDVNDLARSLDLELGRRDLGRTLLGLTLNDRRVVLHSSLRGARQLFVFAHEIAHVLRRRGQFADVANSDEEWFADWFARELVLPRRWLVGLWPRARLGALHVEAETVALQLAATGRAPRLMRNGARVLCGQCGARAHDWQCPCRGRRHDLAAAHALPDMCDLEELHTPTSRRSAWLSLEWPAGFDDGHGTGIHTPDSGGPLGAAPTHAT